MRTLATLAINAFLTGLATAREIPAESKPEVPPNKFQVLQSKRIELGDRALILNRVVPPVVPPAPAAVAVTAEQSEIEEQDEHEQAQKKHETLFLSATVYDRQVTEVRWVVGQQEMRIFTNIDFNLLSGLSEFETDDTCYSFLIGLGNETRAAMDAFDGHATERAAKRIPSLESFSRTRSEYMVANGDISNELPEDFVKAFDALHTFYDSNRQRLAEEYTKREAARIERERRQKENPPVPKDTVINYSIGQGGTRTLDKTTVGGRP